MERIVYKSKVDIWILAVVIIAAAIPFIFVFGITDLIIISSVTLPIIAIVVISMHSIKYIVKGKTLIIKQPFTKPAKYDIEQITSLKFSRNPLSSPAASLDRIEIRFKNDKYPLIISPKHKQQFIAHLSNINNQIIVPIPHPNK